MKNFLVHLIICFLPLSFVLIQSNDAISQTTFKNKSVFYEDDVSDSYKVYAGDLNGDNLDDVIICALSDYELFWRPNNGDGSFGQLKFVCDYAGNVNSIDVADFDQDGDNDILASTGCHCDVVWYSNLDGEGNFSERIYITETANYVSCVLASDIDSDGDIDAVSASLYDNKIAWYENDGYGNFSEEIIISLEIVGPRSIQAADIDGDLDLDIVSGAYLGDMVSWHENIDGQGAFSARQIISEEVGNVTSVDAADIDNDGDIDVVSSSYQDNKIAWYENTNGNGMFGAQQIISDTCLGASEIIVCDIDNDMDMDLIVAPIRGDASLWFVNSGNASFNNQINIQANINGPQNICITDIDNDLDMDVFTSVYNDYNVILNENYTIEIFENPTDAFICKDTIQLFSVVAKDVLEYQWQVKYENSDFWENVCDNEFFLGSNIQTLKIKSFIGNAHLRCKLKSNNVFLYSDSAHLKYDQEPPSISLVEEDSCYYTDMNCEIIIRDYIPLVAAEDNCNGELTIRQNPIAGELFHGLDSEVKIVVTDEMGNNSELLIPLNIIDSISPELICGEDLIVDANRPEGYLVSIDEFGPTQITENCQTPVLSNSLNESSNLIGENIPSGKTKISWELTDASGQADTCSFYITVNKYIDPFDFSVKLMPNPVRDFLYLEYNNVEIEEIIMWDISGRLISKFKAD